MAISKCLCFFFFSKIILAYANTPRFESLFHCMIALWSWASYLNWIMFSIRGYEYNKVCDKYILWHSEYFPTYSHIPFYTEDAKKKKKKTIFLSCSQSSGWKTYYKILYNSLRFGKYKCNRGYLPAALAVFCWQVEM